MRRLMILAVVALMIAVATANLELPSWEIFRDQILVWWATEVSNS